MKLAVFGDVHGNLAALEAALSDAQEQNADSFVCLGDVASFGPQPRETLTRTKALGCPVVMGNADWELLDAAARETLQTSSTTFYDIASWCAEQLNEEDQTFIRTFQKTVRLELDGLPILCFHGSPRSYDDVILATTPDETLTGFFQERAPLMLGGHTHVQLLRRVQDAVFVNPGSVGLPFERLPDGRIQNPARAEYVLVEMLQGQPNITFRRVPYDAQTLLEAVQTSGMPHAGVWSADWSG